MSDAEERRYIQYAVESVRASQQWQYESQSSMSLAPLQRSTTTNLLRPMLPFSQVLVTFELSKLRLAMASAKSRAESKANSKAESRTGLNVKPTNQPAIELATQSTAPRMHYSDLAHSPLLLSEWALPQAYDYAVHRHKAEGELQRSISTPQLTYLLIYSGASCAVSFMELQPVVYTLILALRRASDDRCALMATEMLLELAEHWETDNIVQFVEQGLKLISRLNELGLIY